MANLTGCYDVADEARMGGVVVLPTGKYEVKITATEKKPMKDDKGDLLLLVMQVAKGEHAGKTVYENLCLWHRDDQARTIAKGRFAALRKAVGVPAPKDSTQLHNIRFAIDLQCRKRKDDDGMENRIAEFIHLQNLAPGAPQNAGDIPPFARNAPRPDDDKDMPI